MNYDTVRYEHHIISVCQTFHHKIFFPRFDIYLSIYIFCILCNTLFFNSIFYENLYYKAIPVEVTPPQSDIIWTCYRKDGNRTKKRHIIRKILAKNIITILIEPISTKRRENHLSQTNSLFSTLKIISLRNLVIIPCCIYYTSSPSRAWTCII